MFEEFNLSDADSYIQKPPRGRIYQERQSTSQERLETQQQYQQFQKFYESCQNIQIDFIYLREYFNIPFHDNLNDQEIFKIQKKIYSRRFSINQKKSWSLDEKKVLVWVVGKYCQLNQKNCRFLDNNDFNEIGKYLLRRNVDNIRQKWLSMLKTSLVSQPFTQEEDQQIIILYEKYKNKDNKWKLIANEINNNNLIYRTCKQLRERWINYLDPTLLKIKDPWTDREDLELIYQIQQKGKKWTEIAKNLKRNENQVKNRFNCLLKREDVQDDLNKLIDKVLWKISKQPVVIQQENQDKPVLSSNSQHQSLILTISNIESLKKDEIHQLTPCMVNLKTNQIYFTPIHILQGLLKIEQLDFQDEFELAKKDIEKFEQMPHQFFHSLSIISEEYSIPQNYQQQIQHNIKSLSELSNFESPLIPKYPENNGIFNQIRIFTSLKKKYFKHRTDFTIPSIANKSPWRSLPILIMC
ncbi:unnamed protein product [Paramecium pentaurelia]|uniref:Uncharacterized protein n=1 Tax=Paramecium pentaurelia TaxID=43138 RepID=A0A8S1UQU9_9CILI|nr:unnamed protein product [Paramecium pentaurelia]